MRLAIVGSQLKHWRGYEHNRKAKLWISYGVFFLRPRIIVSGGADGVDQWAEDEADSLGIQKEIYEPAQKTWAHYEARNRQIVAACDALLCIRSRFATTYGSGWTADHAESAGKQVWRVSL